MILIAGGIADRVTELVCARLDDCGFPYRLFDLGHYPDDYRITARWTATGLSGHLSAPDWRLDLNEIGGAYVRFLGPEGRSPATGLAESDAAQLRMEADTSLMMLIDNLPCPVINRMGGGMSNNSKPYQIMLLARAGLKVPPTLLTSDPEAARAFRARHGDVIYKSTSGIRSIVRRMGQAQETRLDYLRNGPAQFQVLIPGDNVRVHTVGERLFATRVFSEALDYRYARRDGLDVRMEPMDLPPDVAAACLRAAGSLGLDHAGIDLKVTPEGEWYCLEVNPCPGFIFYERSTGQPISLAIAEFLQHGAAGRTGDLFPRTSGPDSAVRSPSALA